jgi:hypothetical protein
LRFGVEALKRVYDQLEDAEYQLSRHHKAARTAPVDDWAEWWKKQQPRGVRVRGAS